MGAAPDAELWVGQDPQGAELAGGSRGGAGTLDANSTGVTHLGMGEVPPPNPIWRAKPSLSCSALLVGQWLALPYLSLATGSSEGGRRMRGMRSISCEITYWVMPSCHESPAMGGGCET